MSALQVEFLKTYHTCQPIKTYTVWEVNGGVRVHVRAACMSQTWDCQPFRLDQKVVDIVGEVSPEMKAEILQHFES